MGGCGRARPSGGGYRHTQVARWAARGVRFPHCTTEPSIGHTSPRTTQAALPYARTWPPSRIVGRKPSWQECRPHAPAARRADILAQALTTESIGEKNGPMLLPTCKLGKPYVIAAPWVVQIHLEPQCPKMSGFVRLEKDSERLCVPRASLPVQVVPVRKPAIRGGHCRLVSPGVAPEKDSKEQKGKSAA